MITTIFTVDQWKENLADMPLVEEAQTERTGMADRVPRDILWDVVCPCEEEVELKVKALDLPVDPSSYTTCGEFWVMILDTSLLC